MHSSEASSAAGDLHRSADVRRDEESLSQKSMPAVSGMPGESSQRGLEFTKAEQQALRHYLLCSKSACISLSFYRGFLCLLLHVHLFLHCMEVHRIELSLPEWRQDIHQPRVLPGATVIIAVPI